MKHRLPFGTISFDGPYETINANDILNSKENKEGVPYQITTGGWYDTTYNIYGQIVIPPPVKDPNDLYLPNDFDRNWKLKAYPDPLPEDYYIEYSAQKKQYIGSFAKFTPRINKNKTILDEDNNEIADTKYLSAYNITVGYAIDYWQIVLSDCDVKHRPWKDLEITIRIGQVYSHYIADNYDIGPDEGDHIIEYYDDDGTISYINETITIEGDPFNTDEEKQTHYSINNNPYCEGYLQDDKTFWLAIPCNYQIPEGYRHHIETDPEADPPQDLWEVKKYGVFDIEIISVSPSSVYEPPS